MGNTKTYDKYWNLRFSTEELEQFEGPHSYPIRETKKGRTTAEDVKNYIFGETVDINLSKVIGKHWRSLRA
ncbi:hypothetical protein TWF106_010704 [Orbilia oligospora]|uniref:Uncharacterized protein n=1 Tax=Orbilia oligospora TaxID=2813651 RepID=A0A7C8UHT8_ORBOL|nr:hypothetical protein TWF106_010704 [Orbilia oligospora]